jgi:hypothetical protein
MVSTSPTENLRRGGGTAGGRYQDDNVGSVEQVAQGCWSPVAVTERHPLTGRVPSSAATGPGRVTVSGTNANPCRVPWEICDRLRSQEASTVPGAFRHAGDEQLGAGIEGHDTSLPAGVDRDIDPVAGLSRRRRPRAAVEKRRADRHVRPTPAGRLA